MAIWNELDDGGYRESTVRTLGMGRQRQVLVGYSNAQIRHDERYVANLEASFYRTSAGVD
ncbi:hypothetical protein JCM18750_04680 [Halostagnicola bangensis]